MKKHRHPIILMTLAAIPFFFISVPDYFESRALSELWNLGHLLFFASLSWILLRYWHWLSERTFAQQIITLSAIALGAGIGIEATQSLLPDRHAGLSDIAENIIGAIVAVTLFSRKKKTLNSSTIVIVQISVAALLIKTLSPISLAIYDEVLAKAQFPTLANFKTSGQTSRFEGSAHYEISEGENKNKHFKVKFNTDKYSEISLKHFPGDWRNYQKLTIDIQNPSVNIQKIVLKIQDRQHTKTDQRYSDRFNRSYDLKSGINTISIDLNEVKNAPKNRKLNLAEVHKVSIFTVELSKPLTLYLDNISLK